MEKKNKKNKNKIKQNKQTKNEAKQNKSTYLMASLVPASMRLPSWSVLCSIANAEPALAHEQGK
jgi:hypothetical protein